MIATNWFQKKWGLDDPVLIDELYSRIVDLEQRVRVLEEENVSTTNELYRMENSLDSRIDIIAEHCGINYDV
jgi:chaperonin cofactor prefoldin